MFSVPLMLKDTGFLCLINTFSSFLSMRFCASSHSVRSSNETAFCLCLVADIFLSFVDDDTAE